MTYSTQAYKTKKIQVTCESWNHSKAVCNIPSYYESVVLSTQLSKASCLDNWKHTRSIYNGRYLGAIIVEKACRAVFVVNLTESVNVKNVKCSSENLKTKVCKKKIDLAWVKTRHSNSSCRWGKKGWVYETKNDTSKSYIKVTRGCRATFSYISNLTSTP